MLRLLRRLAGASSAIIEGLGGPRIGGGLNVGTIPPQLNVTHWLNSPDGDSIELDALRGQSVIVEFWSTQCKPCVASVGKIRQAYADYAPKGIQLITVHVNLNDPAPDAPSVQKFLSDYLISYPVGMDGSGAIWERFRFTHLPHGLLIDPTGKVQWSGSLFNHDIEKVLLRFFGDPAPGDQLTTAAIDTAPAESIAAACDGDVCEIPVRKVTKRRDQ